MSTPQATISGLPSTEEEAIPSPVYGLEHSPRSPKGESLIKYEYDIVLGCPRSGTTFLMKVLNAIPDIEGVIGTVLPVSIPHIVQSNLSPQLYDALAVAFERALDEYMESARFNSRAAALQKWYQAPNGLKGLYDALRGERNEDRLVYKEPFLTFAPEFVYYALPDANIIHIYRDGRDCANSLVQTYDVLSDENLTHLRGSEMRLGRKVDDRYVPWWVEHGREEEFLNASQYGRAIWMWTHMVRRCHNFFSRPEVQQSDRVLWIRYEDFVREPRSHGQKILEHLELEPTRHYWRSLQEAYASSISNYKTRPASELKEAHRIAGDELELFGYL